ncbi:MAG: rhodanese-like domain-containing protein [Gemmatimonadota bacterium]|nr:rhodanese-like domain-containing protein [Gemmatimonadota bacterium]
MRRAHLILIAAAVVAGGFAPASAQHSPDSLIVSTGWLAAHLKDPNVVVLQIDAHMGMGDDVPFSAAHIPGARELLLSSIIVDTNGLNSEMPPVARLREAFESVGVSDSSHVVVYYESEAPTAARAVMTLDYLGHDRVSFLDGGLPKWRAEKRELSTKAATVTRGTMHPQIRANVIADAPWIQARIGKSGLALIDTRTDGEYLGTGMRHGLPSTGHLYGARQLQWQQLFEGDSGSEKGAALKSPAELRKLFADRMQPGDTVVTYCWVGYRASATYLAARSLGLPVKIYDGSYEDWARRKLPLRVGAAP